MKTSCGIIIKFEDKVLLCHPSKASRNNSFSFPKGGVEDFDQTFEDTAIRECVEEVGIKVDKSSFKQSFIVDYTKGGSSKILKRVHLFLVEIKNLSDIDLMSITVPKENLQLSEVDWAGFLTKKQALPKIFWRFKHILSKVL
jgi:8-oxo-dGTP pyrophosphatase MutT (NUDIX family)